MFRKLFCFLICISFLAFMFSGCISQLPEPGYQSFAVVLDWTPNTNHTGLFVALEKGYYRAEGIEIEIIQPPEGEALSLVAAGKADFAVSFQEEILVAANAKNPLPIVAIAALLEHNTGGILSLKEKGIESFKDMEGKTYGSWEMPIYDEIVRDCIIAEGGDPSKVDFVPNSVTDNISGIQKDFDTVWVYEAWDKMIAETQGIETNFLHFKDVNPVFDYYTPVLATNEDNLKNKSDIVKKFLKATEKGYEFAKENPLESADILAAHAPETDEGILRVSQAFISSKYFSEKWGYIDPTRWNGFFEWMKEKKLINENASNEAFENISLD